MCANRILRVSEQTGEVGVTRLVLNSNAVSKGLKHLCDSVCGAGKCWTSTPSMKNHIEETVWLVGDMEKGFKIW